MVYTQAAVWCTCRGAGHDGGNGGGFQSAGFGGDTASRRIRDLENNLRAKGGVLEETRRLLHMQYAETDGLRGQLLRLQAELAQQRRSAEAAATTGTTAAATAAGAGVGPAGAAASPQQVKGGEEEAQEKVDSDDKSQPAAGEHAVDDEVAASAGKGGTNHGTGGDAEKGEVRRQPPRATKNGRG
jgi:hypothetical protein